MRVAALYDIHGNLPALDAVLEELARPGVDVIVVGGDVLPGPLPGETLARLRQLDLPVRFIRGNGESAAITLRSGGSIDHLPAPAREATRWVAGQLGADDAEFIAGWPMTCQLSIPPLGEVLFCHATPRNNTEIFTALTPEERLAPIFGELGVDLVVCGHTHIQFDRMIGPTRVVNAGSVGMPFGPPGADWLLLGPDVELRHTDYDLEAAADRVRATGYPNAADLADRYLLHPPTAAEMLATLGKAELKG